MATLLNEWLVIAMLLNKWLVIAMLLNKWLVIATLLNKWLVIATLLNKWLVYATLLNIKIASRTEQQHPIWFYTDTVKTCFLLAHSRMRVCVSLPGLMTSYSTCHCIKIVKQ